METRNDTARLPKYVVAIIGLFVLLQFGVPVIQASQSGSHRWGWQMYSRYPEPGEYRAVLQDGKVREIDVREHLASWRFELTPNDELLSQLCEREPDADAILVRLDDPDEFEEYRCTDS